MSEEEVNPLEQIWEESSDYFIRESREKHVADVMLCATTHIGLRLIRQAGSEGCVRLKDIAEVFGDSIHSVRGAMNRLKKRGVFKKKYLSQWDVVYVLTEDGQDLARCVESIMGRIDSREEI